MWSFKLLFWENEREQISHWWGCIPWNKIIIFFYMRDEDLQILVCHWTPVHGLNQGSNKRKGTVLCTAEGPTFNCYIQEATRWWSKVGSLTAAQGSCSHFILPPCVYWKSWTLSGRTEPPSGPILEFHHGFISKISSVTILSIYVIITYTDLQITVSLFTKIHIN